MYGNILPNSIETRYDTSIGFSQLKYDGQTTGAGLWTRLFLADIPKNTRKSRDYWTREFSIEFNPFDAHINNKSFGNIFYNYLGREVREDNELVEGICY